MFKSVKQMVEQQQEFRAMSAELLAEYEAGTRKFREERDGRLVDVTTEWIETIKLQIDKADAFIAAVKKKHPDEFV